MALSAEDKENLDITAKRLRELLPAELARTDVGAALEDPEEDPRSYLAYLLQECFSPWEMPSICKSGILTQIRF